MATVNWHPESWQKSIKTKALDGVEECAKGLILTTAKERCPVAPINGGTMRNSLGTERDDANLCVYIGGGGAAKKYIFRQHQDMSLNHTTGQAKFITSAIETHSKELKGFVEKHIK
jgi:hypothetical protein